MRVLQHPSAVPASPVDKVQGVRQPVIPLVGTPVVQGSPQAGVGLMASGECLSQIRLGVCGAEKSVEGWSVLECVQLWLAVASPRSFPTKHVRTFSTIRTDSSACRVQVWLILVWSQPNLYADEARPFRDGPGLRRNLREFG